MVSHDDDDGDDVTVDFRFLQSKKSTIALFVYISLFLVYLDISIFSLTTIELQCCHMMSHNVLKRHSFYTDLFIKGEKIYFQNRF